MEGDKVGTGKGEAFISPGDYKKRRAELDDMFVELTLGKVRIEPEGASQFYKAIKSLGIQVDVNKEVVVGKDGPDGSAFKMDFDTEALMENMDDVNMLRACSITREPVIHPTPKKEEKREDDLLYWDQLHPIDRKTMVAALDHPDVGAQGGKFRPKKSGDDPDSADE